MVGLSAGEYGAYTVTGTEAVLEENNDQYGVIFARIFGAFALLFVACVSTSVKKIAFGTFDQSKLLYFHIALWILNLNLGKPPLDIDSRVDRVWLPIGKRYLLYIEISYI